MILIHYNSQSLHILHFLAIVCHILYLLLFRANTGVEKLSGVTLGLGKGVLGVSCDNETVDAFLIASGKSSGKFVGCEVAADDLFSDIVLRMFLPASLVCKE